MTTRQHGNLVHLAMLTTTVTTRASEQRSWSLSHWLLFSTKYLSTSKELGPGICSSPPSTMIGQFISQALLVTKRLGLEPPTSPLSLTDLDSYLVDSPRKLESALSSISG